MRTSSYNHGCASKRRGERERKREEGKKGEEREGKEEEREGEVSFEPAAGAAWFGFASEASVILGVSNELFGSSMETLKHWLHP